MRRNVAGQYLNLFAFVKATNAEKTGDSANITAHVVIDGNYPGNLVTNSPQEVSSANSPGDYQILLTQAETDGDSLVFSAKSSTSGISVIAIPKVVYTTDAVPLAELISVGTGTNSYTLYFSQAVLTIPVSGTADDGFLINGGHPSSVIFQNSKQIVVNFSGGSVTGLDWIMNSQPNWISTQISFGVGVTMSQTEAVVATTIPQTLGNVIKVIQAQGDI